MSDFLACFLGSLAGCCLYDWMEKRRTRQRLIAAERQRILALYEQACGWSHAGARN